MTYAADLPDSEVLRKAVLERYLPACAAFLFIVIVGEALATPGKIDWGTLGVLGTELAAMTVGFTAVTALVRDRLKQTPRLGLRSVAAGLVSPLLIGLASAFVQGATMATIAVLSGAAGAVVGAALAGSSFLRRSPREPALPPAVAAELAQLEADLAHPTFDAASSASDERSAVPRKT